jgi:AcrR family transcriptional regulator
MTNVTDLLAPRRVPKQQRSRERYERVLATGRRLIAERGNDAVSMREIADAADVPISSVYQYLPDKNALLWTLFEAFMADFEAEWHLQIGAAADVTALEAAPGLAFEHLVTRCAEDPDFTRLWMAVQANAVLAELDRASNRRLARAYCRRMIALDPTCDENAEYTRMLLQCTLASAALELAFSREVEADDVLTAFRDLLRPSGG